MPDLYGGLIQTVAITVEGWWAAAGPSARRILLLVPCKRGQSIRHAKYPSIQVLRSPGLSLKQMNGGMSIAYLGILHWDKDWLDQGSSQIEGSSNYWVLTAILRFLRRIDTQLFSHEQSHGIAQP